MTVYKLLHANGYLLVEFPEGLYCLDSGSPRTFGANTTLTMAGMTLCVPQTFCGLSLEAIANTVGRPVAGLLGTDLLNRLDVLIDAPQELVTFSDAPLELCGTSIPLEFQMGVPMVRASVGHRPCKFVFDSGATISYCDDVIETYAQEDPFEDDHPALGRFTTATHRVPVHMADRVFSVRSGRLPRPLAAALDQAGAQGILGNEILLSGRAVYAARRSRLVLQHNS